MEIILVTSHHLRITLGNGGRGKHAGLGNSQITEEKKKIYGHMLSMYLFACPLLLAVLDVCKICVQIHILRCTCRS